jgi:hypothetical protein
VTTRIQKAYVVVRIGLRKQAGDAVYGMVFPIDKDPNLFALAAQVDL